MKITHESVPHDELLHYWLAYHCCVLQWIRQSPATIPRRWQAIKTAQARYVSLN